MKNTINGVIIASLLSVSAAYAQQGTQQNNDTTRLRINECLAKNPSLNESLRNARTLTPTERNKYNKLTILLNQERAKKKSQ